MTSLELASKRTNQDPQIHLLRAIALILQREYEPDYEADDGMRRELLLIGTGGFQGSTAA